MISNGWFSFTPFVSVVFSLMQRTPLLNDMKEERTDRQRLTTELHTCVKTEPGNR